MNDVTTPLPDDKLLQLSQQTEELDLSALRDQIAAIMARAEKHQPSYSDFAIELLNTEIQARKQRKLNRNYKRSGLPPVVEGLDGFDFSIRPKIEARVVKELLNCRWAAEEGRGIICVGRPGLGKTRVLDALGKAACLQGYSVIKTSTAEMLENIHAAHADNTYRKAIKRYSQVGVLIMDEFAYAPFDATATKYLFRVISARHRRRSTLIGANTGFNQWKDLFPSEAEAVATVDRLIDRATILRFSGKSFRKPKEVFGEEAAD
jgi:DNA replication protein DnaC